MSQSTLCDVFHDHPFGLIANDSILDEMGAHLTMPDADKYGLVAPKNYGVGYMHMYHDVINTAFINHVSSCKNPILEIGTAYGVTTLPALENSNVPYIASDVGEENLLILRNRTEPKHHDRLYLKPARFPDELDFDDNTFDVVLISRVLHFLRGEEVEHGLKKIFNWLRPGGKLFLLTCSPYLRNIQEFVPIYEERLKDGHPWPGYVENFRSTSGEHAYNLTEFLHVMDKRILQPLLDRVGFITEKIDYVTYPKKIPQFYLDGREHTGAIVVKPN